MSRRDTPAAALRRLRHTPPLIRTAITASIREQSLRYSHGLHNAFQPTLLMSFSVTAFTLIRCPRYAAPLLRPSHNTHYVDYQPPQLRHFHYWRRYCFELPWIVTYAYSISHCFHIATYISLIHILFSFDIQPRHNITTYLQYTWLWLPPQRMPRHCYAIQPRHTQPLRRYATDTLRCIHVIGWSLRRWQMSCYAIARQCGWQVVRSQYAITPLREQRLRYG